MLEVYHSAVWLETEVPTELSTSYGTMAIPFLTSH